MARNGVKFKYKRSQLFIEKMNGRVWKIFDKEDTSFQEIAFYHLVMIRGKESKLIKTNAEQTKKVLTEETLERSMILIRNLDSIKLASTLYG